MHGEWLCCGLCPPGHLGFGCALLVFPEGASLPGGLQHLLGFPTMGKVALDHSGEPWWCQRQRVLSDGGVFHRCVPLIRMLGIGNYGDLSKGSLHSCSDPCCSFLFSSDQENSGPCFEEGEVLFPSRRVSCPPLFPCPFVWWSMCWLLSLQHASQKMRPPSLASTRG